MVLDHFHAVRLPNTAVDDVRRRVQQEVLGHRGRKGDPLYGIRRLLLVGAERLGERGRARIAAGLAARDRFDEVRAAWTAKELLRAVYAARTCSPLGEHDFATETLVPGHFSRGVPSNGNE